MNFNEFNRHLILGVALLGGTNIQAQDIFIDSEIALPQSSLYDMVAGDYDNDGDLDLLVTGKSGWFKSTIYMNDGNSFSALDLGLPDLDGASAAWGDFNNDGFLDIVLNGYGYWGYYSGMFLNNKAGGFTESGITLLKVANGSCKAFDYDNDGFQDVIMTGSSLYGNICRIYHNDRGSFSERPEISLVGVQKSSISIGDYNNDGFPDIIITGESVPGQPVAKVYRNNNGLTFTEENLFETKWQVIDGSSQWCDYDNDGYLDIFLTGSTICCGSVSQLFHNNHDNTFTTDLTISLEGVSSSSISWSDYDSDGDLDLAISGLDWNSTPVMKVLQNDNSQFTEQFSTSGITNGTVFWMDYNNDLKPDLVVTGETEQSGVFLSKIFKNNSIYSNTKPVAPIKLPATITGADVTLSWNKIMYGGIPATDLTYNIRIGTTNEGNEIVSSNSLSTGYRKLTAFGNCYTNNFYKIKSLKKGTYNWSVQAIDNGLSGGTFATQGTFTITSSSQSYNLNLSNIQSRNAKLRWYRGNLSYCIVFLKEAAAGNALPVNNTTYSANSTFKSGSQIGATGWYCIYKGTMNEITVTGLKASTEYIFQVLEYDGATGSEQYLTSTNPSNPVSFKSGIFSELSGSAITGEPDNDSEWGDLDNDGDLDIVVTTYNNTKIYRNDNGVLNDVGLNLTGYSASSISLGDYDNDGDLDILLAGSTSSKITKVYKNSSINNFQEQTSIVLPGISGGTASWIDINNDGLMDIFLTGSSTNKSISTIFLNEGKNIFTEQKQINLPGIWDATGSWADYDNDGYMDLLLIGRYNWTTVAKIYHNNGDKTFSEQNTFTLNGLRSSSASWGDYNGDGYADIIMTGSYYTFLYKNNSGTSFSEQTDITLPGVENGSIQWGDYDNDGDLDLLITGADRNGDIFPKLFRNDGNNSFTRYTGNFLPGFSNCSGKFGDFDGDGDLDILLSGLYFDNMTTLGGSKILKNDITTANVKPAAPSGLVSKVNNTGNIYSLLNWNRIKTDNTPYLSLTYNIQIGTKSGYSNAVPSHSLSGGMRKIVSTGNAGYNNFYYFKNLRWDTIYYAKVQAIDNGYMGGFFSGEIQFSTTAIQSSELNAIIVNSNSLKFKWKRGNGNSCVVFAKVNTTEVPNPVNYVSYYGNPVYGDGSPIGTTGWYCVYKGKTDSLNLTGLNPEYRYSLYVYEMQGSAGNEVYYKTNNMTNHGVFSTSLFTEISEVVLPQQTYSRTEWGDYDNDGFSDILYSNYPPKIFHNNGDYTFSETGTSIPGGTLKWGDFNNDGFLDILSVSNTATKIYLNNGSQNFLEQSGFSAAIRNSYPRSSIACSDYDNDSYLDFIVSGEDASTGKLVTALFHNNGDGTYSQKFQGLFEGVNGGSLNFFDYDKDGFSDLLLTGYNNQNASVSRLYHNKDASFSIVTNIPFPDLSSSSVSIGDFDNDDDADVLITGYPKTTKLFSNSEGVFSEQPGTGFQSISAGATLWADFNNDGFLDLLISGQKANFESIITLYLNDKHSNFFEAPNIFLKESSYSSLSTVDYDNDGDIDLLITGSIIGGSPVAKFYRNNLINNTGYFTSNKKPTQPVNLSYDSNPNKIILDWSPVSGDETPSNCLTYNLRYRLSGSAKWLYDSRSASNGFRIVPEIGNLQLARSYSFKNLPGGIYEWQIQAVDQAYAGSPWSAISTFEVKNVQAFFSSDEVCQGLKTTFKDNSVASAGKASWKWDFNDGTFSTEQDPIHTYNQSGTYNVKLVITDTGGTKDSLVQAVVVRPKPLADFSATSVCQGIPVTATNITNGNGLTVTSYKWDYGDGSVISTDFQPGPHPYLNASDYTIKLRAEASNGCADSVSKVVSVGSYPVAAVTSSRNLTFCKGDSVTLTVPFVSSYSYTWKTSGTNLTGATGNTYKAKNSGNYSVEIVNPKGNCISTSPSIIVTALDAPSSPLISYEGSLQFCQGDSLILSVSQASGHTYEWKKDGGTVGTNKNSFPAKSSGLYSVSVTNSSTCKANSLNTVNVTVDPKPVVPTVSINGQTSFCQGQNVILSVPGNSSYTYQWQINSSGIIGATTNTYTAERSGTYSLKILNDKGCQSKTEDVSVIVSESPAPPSISYNGPQEFCQGDSILLSVPNTSGNSYSWKLNGGAVGTDKNSFAATSSGEYSLVTKNSSGCSVESVNKITINVNPKPNLPVISTSGISTFCQGSSVDLSVPAVAGNLYSWRNENGVIPGITTNSYTASASGSYLVDIANSYGCAVTTSAVKVTVKPSPLRPAFAQFNYTKGKCPGEEPIRLSAEQSVPGYRYTWYRNGLPQQYDTLSHIEFFESGNYKLAADLDGCTAESDIFSAEFPEGLPKPIIYAQGPTFWYLACSNTEAAKYRWYFNGKAIDGADKYFYLANYTLGNYQVSIANKEGCYTRSDVITIPPGYTGVDDIEPFDGIKIYPNPSSGIFTIEMDNNISGKLSIEIVSPDGKKIRRAEIEKTRQHLLYQVDLSGQPEGMYIINLVLNKINTTRKILID